MNTKIKLPRKITERIRKFWDKNGGNGYSMLAQPVWRGDGYTLKIKMLPPQTADRIANLISKLQ